MQYNQLGRSGLTVSAVGLGCNNFGKRLNQEQSRAVVDAAIDEGITFLDTADVYGDSEEYLGDILGKRREGVVLATKFGSPTGGRVAADHEARGGRRYIKIAVEASLRRLQTDYIDLLQFHEPDPRTPIEETLAALDDLVRAGTVRYIGSSNVAAWQVVEADLVARSLGSSRFISVQNEYSLVNRSIEDGVLPVARKYGLGVVPFFPLAKGLLSGKYSRGVQTGTRPARRAGEGRLPARRAVRSCGGARNLRQGAGPLPDRRRHRRPRGAGRRLHRDRRCHPSRAGQDQRRCDPLGPRGGRPGGARPNHRRARAGVTPYTPGAGTRTLWWGTVADTDVTTLASAAAAAGFDAIAVTPGMHREIADRIAEVRGALFDEGIRVQLVDPLVSALPGSPALDDVPGHLRKHFVHTAEDAFRAAEDFGGADVCVGGFLGMPVTYSEVRDAVATLAEQARRHNARVLVEFMPRTQIPDLATAVALVEEVAAPNLGLVFDTWHFTRIGGTTADIRALPPGIVTSIQVADRDAGADHRPYVPMAGRTLPGEGALPLREWLAALLANSSGADVGAEVFSDDLRALPVEVAAAAAGTALRSVLLDRPADDDVPSSTGGTT